MEFVLLVFVNIIMATIFYLVIRLKLEKTASGYRDKKVRREIDEMISEFNEVAERNISILESRISCMKSLLENSGQLKSVDFRVDDSGEREKNSLPASPSHAGRKKDIIFENAAEQKPGIERPAGAQETARDIQNIIMEKTAAAREIIIKLKGIAIGKFRYYKDYFINNFYDKLSSTAVETADMGADDAKIEIDAAFNAGPSIAVEIPAEALRRDKHSIVKSLNAGAVLELSEGEIIDMFLKSGDKYSLVSELFHKGYSTSVITRCSGIPIGEVKLVLDLNDSL